MNTFLIGDEITISRQEGDTSYIEFQDIPTEISLVGASAKFQVKKKSKSDTAIISKTDASGITISGQNLTVNLLPSDTKNYAGRWRWELQITLQNTSIITIARGNFIIVAELID